MTTWVYVDESKRAGYVIAAVAVTDPLGETGDVVSIAHGIVSVVETFPATLVGVGAFHAEYVAESPTGTFAADRSGGDGIGLPAIVTFRPGATPSCSGRLERTRRKGMGLGAPVGSTYVTTRIAQRGPGALARRPSAVSSSQSSASARAT